MLTTYALSCNHATLKVKNCSCADCKLRNMLEVVMQKKLVPRFAMPMETRFTTLFILQYNIAAWQIAKTLHVILGLT